MRPCYFAPVAALRENQMQTNIANVVGTMLISTISDLRAGAAITAA
jgi:hypothetical protein